MWRPKVENKYIPLEYGNDIDDGVFDFKQCGNKVFRPAKTWADKPRSDLILYDVKKDTAELDKGLAIGRTVSLPN